MVVLDRPVVQAFVQDVIVDDQDECDVAVTPSTGDGDSATAVATGGANPHVAAAITNASAACAADNAYSASAFHSVIYDVIVNGDNDIESIGKQNTHPVDVVEEQNVINIKEEGADKEIERRNMSSHTLELQARQVWYRQVMFRHKGWQLRLLAAFLEKSTSTQITTMMSNSWPMNTIKVPYRSHSNVPLFIVRSTFRSVPIHHHRLYCKRQDTNT